MKSDKFCQVQFHTFAKMCAVHIFPSTVHGFSCTFQIPSCTVHICIFFRKILYSTEIFLYVLNFFCTYKIFPAHSRFLPVLCIFFSSSEKFCTVQFFSCTYMTFPVHFKMLPVLYSFVCSVCKICTFQEFLCTYRRKAVLSIVLSK